MNDICSCILDHANSYIHAWIFHLCFEQKKKWKWHNCWVFFQLKNWNWVSDKINNSNIWLKFFLSKYLDIRTHINQQQYLLRLQTISWFYYNSYENFGGTLQFPILLKNQIFFWKNSQMSIKMFITFYFYCKFSATE